MLYLLFNYYYYLLFIIVVIIIIIVNFILIWQFCENTSYLIFTAVCKLNLKNQKCVSFSVLFDGF